LSHVPRHVKKEKHLKNEGKTTNFAPGCYPMRPRCMSPTRGEFTTVPRAPSAFTTWLALPMCFAYFSPVGWRKKPCNLMKPQLKKMLI